jgi:hypothetical protein
MRSIEPQMHNCASGNLEIPGLVLTHHPGMTFAQTQVRVLAARGRPGCCANHPRKNQRAQGRPGARCTRGLVCQTGKQKRTRAYRFSGDIRPSLRNGFTAYTALSPVTGLSCHRHRRDTSRQLDASVGASGPHGFAVRVRRVRLARHSRPPHPTPRS